MADEDIIQNLIYQLGQSQDERLPRELDAAFVQVDERTPEDLWAWLRRFAALVNYYPAAPAAPPTDWTPLLPGAGQTLADYLATREGAVPPHLALLLAFQELYRTPQALANQSTARHLDFYYHDVLRLEKRGPVADRAHLLIELKKGAASVAVRPEHLFTAGKDATGVELLYAPVREAVVGPGVVDSLRSIYLDRAGRGTVRFAPVADSADGLGGKLPAADPKWQGFGYPGLPRAEIGFALASPVLRLREGERKVTVRLALSGADPTRLSTASLSGAFGAFLTGEKSWIEADAVAATLGSNGVLQLEITLPASAAPVVDYQPAVHGYAYAAAAPILQLLLLPDAKVGYLDFDGVVLRTAQLSVDVAGVTSLTLESDAGTLDARKAFLPFGPQPTAGSRFMVAYPEALTKKLSSLKLTLQWKDAPADFHSYYANYGVTVSNGSFTAGASFRDGAGAEVKRSGVKLFATGNAAAQQVISLLDSAPGGGAQERRHFAGGPVIRALQLAGAEWSMREAGRFVRARPIQASYLRSTPPPREGFVTLTLEHGFLQAEYRKKYVENVLAFAKQTDSSATPVILNEPYTPVVQSISLSYQAHTDTVAISSTEASDFANPDVQFFQVAPFGPMREHGYQRQRFSWLGGPEVRLLPPVPHTGELLVGVTGVGPGDGLSLLFQVASGSADPELPREDLQWFVLCDDYWKPLAPDELVLDTTNQMLASGIVKLVIPAEATTLHTVLPAGHVWIRAGVTGNPAAVAQLLRVAANGVEVRLVDEGNDPAHLESALPAGSITGLRTAIAGVKTVTQPYASFGGSPAEKDPAFRTRVSERLRHRDRCITPWDYERVVLEAFPEVHKVKCIPHAREGSWRAPGHVMLVVVPDLRNRNAVDPLRPRVDADTLDRIADHVRARAGMGVELSVKNPSYQTVRLDFGVRFRTGYDFNHYRTELENVLIRALSPWAFDATRDLAFGGVVYRSVLLDVVEELYYVDFVTDFRMYSPAGATERVDRAEARPATPDTILVSDRGHTITEAA